MTSSDNIVKKNSLYLKDHVKYFNVQGSSIVYQTNLVTLPPKPKIEKFYNKEVEKINETYTTVGSDYIYLLSHQTSIGTEKVNLTSTIDTLGIDVLESFKSKTNSMVRGEKLIELLSLIVDFLTDHVHNPNESPDEGPYGSKELTKQKLRDALADAQNTVLNQNIRIN
jgi:hypothetical protein